MSCILRTSLVSITFILCVFQIVAQDVIECSGDCDCPSTSMHMGKSCTLRCNGKNKCKNGILTCREDDACIIDCNGAYSCAGNTIQCGTKSCSISCGGTSSCHDTIAYVQSATMLLCIGHCDSLSIHSAPSNPSYNPSVPPTPNPLLISTSQPPTIFPTNNPTLIPTNNPTLIPTLSPTFAATSLSIKPIAATSPPSTRNPTVNPTVLPTINSTSFPTINHHSEASLRSVASQQSLSTNAHDIRGINLTISSTLSHSQFPVITMVEMMAPTANHGSNFFISVAMWHIIKASIAFILGCSCVCLGICVCRALCCSKNAVTAKSNETEPCDVEINDTPTVTINRMATPDGATTFEPHSRKPNTAPVVSDAKNNNCDMDEESSTSTTESTTELNLYDKEAYISAMQSAAWDMFPPPVNEFNIDTTPERQDPYYGNLAVWSTPRSPPV